MKIPQSPIDLPERTVGRFSIKHDYIKEAYLVSMREMVLTGKKPIRINYETPHRIHQLVEKGHGVWMSDIPAELRQIDEALRKEKWHGHVLVGGLGLGLVVEKLLAKRNVGFVTVVEKNPEVIQLTSPENDRCGIVHKDIFKYISDLKIWPFDLAYLDTWSGTSESTWWEYVFPLRRLIANKFGRQKIVCWAEDQMRGQVYRSLTNAPPHWKYKETPWFPAKAKRFLNNVGLKNWEKEFGELYPME